MTLPTRHPAPLAVLRFDPRQAGLRRWLGALEAATMRAAWAAGEPTTIKRLWRALQRAHNPSLAYTTVATTVGVLGRKGLLVRDQAPRQHNTHMYAPCCSEAEFVAFQVTAVLQSLEG